MDSHDELDHQRIHLRNCFWHVDFRSHWHSDGVCRADYDFRVSDYGSDEVQQRTTLELSPDDQVPAGKLGLCGSTIEVAL